MATAKNAGPEHTSKRRVALGIGALVLIALGAYLATNWAFISGQLRVGTAYGARVACSCHYIGGRSIEDCEKDFEPGMELIGLANDPEKRRVTASVPLLASGTAEFREGWGCVMLGEDELAAEG